MAEADDLDGTETGADDAGQDSDESGLPPIILDVGGGEDDGPPGTDEECAAFSAKATLEAKPADILWVVDNSPSMLEETDAVQQRLGEFSQQIVGADIDVRVFLLSAYPNPAVDPALDTGICIEPPLGGGGCPHGDNNSPTFGHSHANIGSTHALSKLIDTHEVWAPMIRDGSAIHVIVVSDDDSHLSAASFDEQFLALDPRHEGYKLHGIVPTQLCPFADTIGSTYVQLAEQTGGIVGDLCQQEFQPLFDLLSTAVTEGTALACDWSLPEAPEGRIIDPDSVSVIYEDDDGTLTELTALDDLSACEGVQYGWYYSDNANPDHVVACPSTCDVLQQAEQASIQIDIGCATNPVG